MLLSEPRSVFIGGCPLANHSSYAIRRDDNGTPRYHEIVSNGESRGAGQHDQIGLAARELIAILIKRNRVPIQLRRLRHHRRADNRSHNHAFLHYVVSLYFPVYLRCGRSPPPTPMRSGIAVSARPCATHEIFLSHSGSQYQASNVWTAAMVRVMRS